MPTRTTATATTAAEPTPGTGSRNAGRRARTRLSPRHSAGRRPRRLPGRGRDRHRDRRASRAPFGCRLIGGTAARWTCPGAEQHPTPYVEPRLRLRCSAYLASSLGRTCRKQSRRSSVVRTGHGNAIPNTPQRSALVSQMDAVGYEPTDHASSARAPTPGNSVRSNNGGSGTIHPELGRVRRRGGEAGGVQGAVRREATGSMRQLPRHPT
jgi:hypothetical protein